MKTSPSFLAPLIQAPHSPHQIHVCSLHCQETVLCSMGHKKKFNDFYQYTGTIKGKHITNNCTELPLVSKASKCAHKPAQTPHKGRFQSSCFSIIFLTPSLKTKTRRLSSLLPQQYNSSITKESFRTCSATNSC